VAESGLTVENLRGRVRGFFHEAQSMAAKAIVALIVAACVPAHAQSAPDFTWTQHPTVTWADFKDQPPKSVAYPSAVSDTGFKYQLVCRNGMLDIHAAAFFSPSGSWAKPDERTAELLKHEQGHFDMAESYALRLRKAALDAKVRCDDRAKANVAGQRMVAEFQQR